MRHFNDISSSMLDAACQQMAQNHPLRGTWVDGDKPLLVFPAPPKCVSRPEDLQSFHICRPCRVIGVLGTHMVIPVVIECTDEMTQIVVPLGDPLVERLRLGPFSIAFAHVGKYLIAGEGQLPGGERQESFLKVPEMTSSLLSDPSAAWYELLGRLAWVNDQLTVSDRLSTGWANAYACRLEYLQKDLNHLQSGPPFHPCRDEPLSDMATCCLRWLSDCGYRVEKLLEVMAKDVGDNGQYLYRILISSQELYRHEGICTPKHVSHAFGAAVFQVGKMYAWSQRWSHFGHRAPWIDTEEKSVRMRDLHPKEFPMGFDAGDYWDREFHLEYEGGRILAPHDIPVDPARLVEEIETFPAAENVAEASALLAKLLEEALTNKVWTIPPRAIVQCDIGLFRHVELHEIASNVFAVLRTAEGETYQAVVSPLLSYCVFDIPVINEKTDRQQKEKVEAAVRLALCAIVRDFWVMEERERAFGARLATGLPFKKRSPTEGGHVVYLPRVQFHDHPNTERAGGGLHYQERRAHTVSGHLRRCERPSECQIILATRYGFQVPDGFTFVRPHERGNGTVGEVVYRSRSAIQLLYPQRNVAVDGEIDGWFRFERQMRNWIMANGWSIEHVSESRRRDRSIEVFARRTEAEGSEAWIIHCKAIHPRRRLGSQAVCHLMDVLQQYPPSTRGMLIVTGCFSSETQQQAEASGIRLIDGSQLTTATCGLTSPAV